MPTDGKLEIKNGASITGKTAVYVKSGIITILGGTLKGTGDKAAYSHNGNGANATGDALVVDNCGYPGGAPKVTISGGTFTSANNRGIGSYYGNTATALAHVHASSNTIKIHDSSVDTKWHEIWVTEESGYKLVQGWTVTFKDGEAEPELDRQEIESGKKATAPNPAPTKTGYAFKEWQKGGQTYDFDTSVTADITLTANWTANTYTVAFDKNEGAGTMASQSFTYDVEQALTANSFTREGYSFDSWNTAANGSGTKYADKVKVKNLASANGASVTLYAQWKANKYTITFDTDGGSKIDPITKDYNATVTAPADPTKEGYTFKGWDQTIPATMPAEDLTVKAQWTVNQYTITFDTDGGSKIDSVKVAFGTAVKAPADPTKEGYTFKGWSPALPATMPAKNLTVKAQWTANQYTITFDTDGGSKIDAIKQDFGTAVKAPKDPTKAGYTFKGWSPELPKTMPAKDLTVKTRWTANQYTITFDTDGGSEVEAIKQGFGTEVKAPADPTKTGYTFQGWSPELPKTIPAKNLTVKAQWKANGYTVAFDKNGGAGAMAAESFTYDAEQKLTANAFTRSGYTFTGWNTKADGSGQAYADQQSVKNLSAEDGATVTLYAQWSKDTAPSMMLAIATASGRTAMRVKWTKVKGADGYDVFMSKCGASEFRRVGSVKASASRVVTVRKLERSTEYKFYVKAWTRKNGKKTYIVTSPTAHALTGGANARYTNPSKVSVKRSSYTLKVGKTATIRATVTGLKKGKEVLNHVGLVRYITSNAKVAKVNSKGKIVAKGKGTCTIYVIATNGVYAKVKVTVK